ncbi:hypothetical protein C8R43DRAFT_1233364 [Mycena crocata]|nr:hypothetical protein C8R43DRAFT_1233364 [Mycena crocata]
MPRVDTTPVRQAKRNARQRLSHGGPSSSSARTAASSARRSAGESISAPVVKREVTPTPIPAATNLRPDNKGWRHPDELQYIRSGGKKWDDMAIVRFLRANAFGLPPRSPTTTEPWVHVQCADGTTVHLPRGYRLPLMWVATYLWTSLKLVLTAHAAIRQREWDSTKFEILHILRLCAELLGKARAQTESGGVMERSWRCPAFDRALRRYWYEWLISRDEFIRDFWREFGEEEFEGDILKLGWGQWVVKGHKGFSLTKEEVANGITLEQFTKGFMVDEEKSRFGWNGSFLDAPKNTRPHVPHDVVVVEVPHKTIPPVNTSSTNVVSFRVNPKKAFGPALQKIVPQAEPQQPTPISATPRVNTEDGVGPVGSPRHISVPATTPTAEPQPMVPESRLPVDVSLPPAIQEGVMNRDAQAGQVHSAARVSTPLEISIPDAERTPIADTEQASLRTSPLPSLHGEHAAEPRVSADVNMVDVDVSTDVPMPEDIPSLASASVNHPVLQQYDAGPQVDSQLNLLGNTNSPSREPEDGTPAEKDAPVVETMQLDIDPSTRETTYPSPLSDGSPQNTLFNNAVQLLTTNHGSEDSNVRNYEAQEEEESSGEENLEEEDANMDEQSMQPLSSLQAKQELLEQTLPPATQSDFDSIEDLDLADLELLYPDGPMDEQPVGSPSQSQDQSQSPEASGSFSPLRSSSGSPSPVLPPLSSARFPPTLTSATDASTPMEVTAPGAVSAYQRPYHDLELEMGSQIVPFLQSCAMLGEEMRSLRAEVGQLRAQLSAPTPTMELSQRVQALEERVSTPPVIPAPARKIETVRMGSGSWAHPLQHLISGDDIHSQMDVEPSAAVADGHTPTRYRSAEGEPLPPRSRKFNSSRSV